MQEMHRAMLRPAGAPGSPQGLHSVHEASHGHKPINRRAQGRRLAAGARLAMSLPTVDEVWRQLVRAGADRRHPWRVVAFCTQGSERPAARSVILRRVSVGERKLLFYTDARSGKVAELAACPRVALLMWDPGHRQQLRVDGIASLEHDATVVGQHWAAVPEAARRDYAGVSAPGAAASNAAADGSTAIDLATARRHFSVVKVQVQSMDFLQLDRDAHHRGRYDWDGDLGEWRVQPLVP